ncbi:MAG TPA: cupin domain-containing protein [Vineibacter sp.]|nr:cupin domain-containing protein [Vineibacter sp.]
MARCAALSRSADGSAWTDLWDCTAGSFRWHYSVNETIHVIDGGAIVTDRDGTVWDLAPGDVMQFLVGTEALWQVPRYVRKIAFSSEPVRSPLVRLLQSNHRINRLANKVFRYA